MKPGWIGLGRLGTPMAQRLLAACGRLQVCDKNEAQGAELVMKGAVWAESPAAMARQVECVLLCVSDADAVEQILFGPAGVVAGAAPGLLVVDHSTVHPERAVAFARRCRNGTGVRYIDAPVSGGPQVALEGQLAAWVGGDRREYDAARSCMQAYAARIEHMGPVGSGQLAKSCNQAIVSTTIAAWAEMLRYAAACGLDPRRVVRSMEGSASDSPVRRVFGEELGRGTLPLLSQRNMTKDLTALMQQAAAAGIDMPLAATALNAFLSGQIGQPSVPVPGAPSGTQAQRH